MNNLYRSVIKRELKFRKTTIIGTLFTIVASLALIPFIGAEFMPSAEEGQIDVTVETTPGSSLAYTEGIVEQVNEKLDDYEAIIETNFLSVGGGDFVGMGGGDVGG